MGQSAGGSFRQSRAGMILILPDDSAGQEAKTFHYPEWRFSKIGTRQQVAVVRLLSRSVDTRVGGHAPK